MKQPLLLFVICIAAITLQTTAQTNTFPATGATGIGTTAPDASSLLDVTSTTKGLLTPRMTLAQRNAIASPATGLLIYQTNSNPGFYYYTGSAWTQLKQTSASKTLNNLKAPVAINVEMLPGFDDSLNFGSATKSWNDLYLKGDIFLYGQRFISNKGVGNTYVGSNSGTYVGIGGANNTFVGSNSGVDNGGTGNAGFGANTLEANSSGSYNTANGTSALGGNYGGNCNTATGFQSLYLNQFGNSNTANGYNSLHSNVYASYNTATGFNALYSNRLGASNVAVGVCALFSNTDRSNLIAIGDSALFNNGIGATQNYEATDNTAVGSKALYANTSGYGNIAIGNSSLQKNTTGYNNTANGAFALKENTTGNQNTAIGILTLTNNTTGGDNTANGALALYYNTTGNENTANGADALGSNTTGSYNSATGLQSLYLNTTGSSNTANGFRSLYSNRVGNFNTANGHQSLYSNTTGLGNTANGVNALDSNITGSYNTALGYSADVLNGNLSNTTAIGYNANVNASNKVRIGNGSVTSIGGKVGWTTFSDGRIKKNIKENVPGLNFINLLKPVTYNYNLEKEYELMGQKDTAQWEGKNNIEKINFTGFIAQDVDAAAKEIDYDFSGVDKTGDILGLRYAEFTVPLVKAVQELSNQNDDQQMQNEDLKKQMAATDKAISDLQNQLNEMNQCVQFLCDHSSLKSASSSVTSESKLLQNQPNPFNRVTVIAYELTTEYSSGVIVIRDLNGNLIKSIAVSNTGKGQVTVNANELAAGTFTYSLFVNDKCVDTKLMVITK